MSEQPKTLAQRLIRNVNDATLKHFIREPLYESHRARISSNTAAKKLGACLEVLPPGQRVCPYHLHHAQEELFIIFEGSGTLRVAGEHLPITAGDVIFIPAGPEYPHQIINSSDAPLKYLSVSTQEEPEICEYPDSGKFMAEGSMDREQPFEVIGKSDASLNYWDGEP